MSTFYEWFSKIHFPSQCLFHEKAVDFTISLYYNMYVGSPFFTNSSFKNILQEVFHNKSVPKKFRKTNRKLYVPAFLLFTMKLKVAGWKETAVLVHSCEFYYIFKNDYVAVHVWTAASDILGYAHVGISARSALKKCTVFSRILYSFILNWFQNLVQPQGCI